MTERMGLLSGKTAIVTGGASGLGEATCRLMVAEGARVIVADIQDDKGVAVADDLGDAATYRHVDVTSEDEIRAVVDEAVDRWDRLDCMYNNAGIVGAVGPIDEMPLDDWQFSIDVLLRSVFLGSKHAARVMKAQRFGVILATSSVAGLQGGLGPHAYTMAKTAVVGFTRNLAAELGPYSVRANAIAPGKINTPMNADVLFGDPEALDRSLEYFKTQGTPLAGKPGLPADIADTAVWLMSDRSAFVTGQTIVVDGGLTTGSIEGAEAGQGRFANHEPLLREGGRRGR
ncbi:SDR family NAD(P)-dependent oxidoreductase [Ilumatobacter sp.]|uniref:SDR family NAD(P)-dependent oxidoreductase n=1 Tax=Ilumatobacter sp. TaxID=1967498 RepID=UPI003B5155C6